MTISQNKSTKAPSAKTNCGMYVWREEREEREERKEGEERG